MLVESTIVSRYISSMKKKPSLQGVINRVKKHPYERPVSSSDVSMPKNVSAVTQHSSAKKETESVQKKNMYFFLYFLSKILKYITLMINILY